MNVYCLHVSKIVSLDLSLVMMDSTEFESPLYQRVYQYLRRYIGEYNLDTFSYAANVEGSPENCLEVITR